MRMMRMMRRMGLMGFMGVMGILMLASCDRELRKELAELRNELARQQQYVPLERDTIRDSVETITQKIVEVETIKEVLTDEDRKLLKDAGIAVKELISLQKTGMVTSGVVMMSSRDTAAYSTDSAKVTRDTLFYKDAWAEFEFYNRRLRYSVRDSLGIAVKKEYKHRFLFLKWGTKGYQVKVINFNPNATIRYNTFVKRKE